MACSYVADSCVHVNARMHRFSKNLEHTSKLKAPEGYVKQLAYCALKILDFPVQNVVAAATWQSGFMPIWANEFPVFIHGRESVELVATVSFSGKTVLPGH